MRRPPRPFTVEIKSSRRPAGRRTPVPTLVDQSRTEPLFQDLLLRGNQEAGQDRRPAQAAGLHAVAQQGPEVEVIAPEQPRAAGRGAEPRQARILPDLLSLSRAGAPFSPEAEKRSAPHSPKVEERVEPGAAEMSPDLNETARLDAGHEDGEHAEMEAPASCDTLERTAAEQGDLPASLRPEVIASPEL